MKSKIQISIENDQILLIKYFLSYNKNVSFQTHARVMTNIILRILRCNLISYIDNQCMKENYHE